MKKVVTLLAFVATAVAQASCKFENGCQCVEDTDCVNGLTCVSGTCAVSEFDWSTEWWRLVVTVVLILNSALFSGLTLGLMGLDQNGLKIAIGGASETEAGYAKKILPLRKRGNLLLCTLLMGNVAVNAALSIVMADMTSGLVGFLVSTFVIVIFGEIIPQAICSRFPLYIGAHTIWLVKIIMGILFLLVYPLSLVLDKLLGEEMGTLYSKKELRELVALHNEQKDHVQGGVDQNEANILTGALDFADKEVSQIMTPIAEVFMLEVNRRLDFTVLSEIFKSGYSRIPCYNSQKTGDNIEGLLFVKDLILIDPADEIPVRSILQFYGRPLERVYPDHKLSEMLEIFKSGKSHLGLVTEINNEGPGDPFPFLVGIVTLEDIIEEILGAEIEDEEDVRRGNYTERQLRMFDTRRYMPDVLTPQEASAVFFHLTGSLSLFGAHSQLSENGIKKLIAESPVVQVQVDEKSDQTIQFEAWPLPYDAKLDVDNGGKYIYQMGAPSENFCLILDGVVEIRAGRDGFKSEVGRWSIVGTGAITLTKDQILSDYKSLDPFIPDFSAKVMENARVLRISRKAYQQAILDELQQLRTTGSLSSAVEEATKGRPRSDSVSVNQRTRFQLTSFHQEVLGDAVATTSKEVSVDNKDVLIPSVVRRNSFSRSSRKSRSRRSNSPSRENAVARGSSQALLAPDSIVVED
mmetsp:Transcript_3544/g.6716  ORF Transcript_3544/g.6716 Transcript_3544/m.6716 type:complete len:692 (-) Transcript_3544:69-2144(-)